MKDLCGICGKPFEKKSTRFLHFMNHVTLHEAVAYFDKRGNWRFEKVGMEQGNHVPVNHGIADALVQNAPIEERTA